MPDLTPAQIIERLRWTPHVIKEGSREHVSIIGVIEREREFIPVTWCTSPFCELNRSEVEFLISKGVDVVGAQPPPLLRAALSECP